MRERISVGARERECVCVRYSMSPFQATPTRGLTVVSSVPLNMYTKLLLILDV